MSSVFTVSVRDHVMIAHSLRGEVFGPAQRLHGATYVVEANFRRATLTADGIVVDIGRATQVLHDLLAEFNYRNLDDESAFAGRNTTTEVLAQTIADRLVDAIGAGAIPDGDGLDAVTITLHESPTAAASYERGL